MPTNLPPVQITANSNVFSGSVATKLLEHDMDFGILRPWREVNTKGRYTGRTFVTLKTGRKDKTGKPLTVNKLITNTPSLLRREDWLEITKKAIWQNKNRLQLYNDIAASNRRTVTDPMGTISILSKVADGNADVTISMDGIKRSERTRPAQDYTMVPLPIIHSDGGFTLREVAVTRKSGDPLDTTEIRLAVRAVGEAIEKMSMGLYSYSYANGTLYGLLNVPSRSIKIITRPDTAAWTPKTMVDEFIAAMKTMYDNFFRGPYTLYYASDYLPYFQGDYSTLYNGDTLATRLSKISELKESKVLDYLPAWTAVLIQRESDYIEAIDAMPIRTYQWDSLDGMEFGFKTMAMQYLKLTPDYSGHIPVMHMLATLGATTTTTTTTVTTTTATTTT